MKFFIIATIPIFCRMMFVSRETVEVCKWYVKRSSIKGRYMLRNNEDSRVRFALWKDSGQIFCKGIGIQGPKFIWILNRMCGVKLQSAPNNRFIDM